MTETPDLAEEHAATPTNELHVGTDRITLIEHHKPFSMWTDEQIRDRAAALHARAGAITLDATRPVIREGATVALVPAWIEVAPWD